MKNRGTKLPETGKCVICGTRCTVYSSIYVDQRSTTCMKVRLPAKRNFMCQDCWNNSLKKG